MARNSIATKYVIGLVNDNMQLQLKTLTGNPTNKYEEFLKEIFDFEREQFVTNVYRAARATSPAFLSGDHLIKLFDESEDCLVPLLTEYNEECLNDPLLTQAILKGEPYTKLIGTHHREVMYYPEGSSFSKTNDVDMNLYFVPSRSNTEPNAFRIEMIEHLAGKEEYPQVSFSVDIGEDGSVVYYQPTLSDKESEEAELVSCPCEMDRAHFDFDKRGITALTQLFGHVFEITGIKEITEDYSKN